MTPHRHWFKSYTHCRTPIRLANNIVIYSAGVGNVVFEPIVNGKQVGAVEFSRVLHVPDLRSNLLSCLYLTRHKGITINISSHSMVFRQRRKTLFTASIDSSNSATLNGFTVASEAACVVSILPADLSLWHHRFTHYNYADVKKMVEHKLVTGLVLDSDNKPDPICEPCIAGKMSANPFPPSANHNCFPLALVHSDLHGSLPVATHQGYKYWITFINNSTRFRSIHLLKFKSQAVEAFKDYKTWAENQLSAKILELQNDKGGEYISKEFLQFTTQYGIQRCHSTRN